LFYIVKRILEEEPSLPEYAFVNKERPDKNDCVEYRSCLHRNLCSTETKNSCFSRRKQCYDYDCRKLCKAYVSKHCLLLDIPPYVCTGCPEQKMCKKNHVYYTAHRAHAEYIRGLKQSRQGLHASAEELIDIGNLISPLIMKGQSINHIFATHAEDIGLSERTLYNYIDQNAFKVRNIDLPKKVRYKKRRQKKVLTKIEYKCRRVEHMKILKAISCFILRLLSMKWILLKAQEARAKFY